MQELLAQAFIEIQSAWRFRWYAAAAAWAVCLTGWAWVALQPNVYEANAVVYVDTSSVLRPFLRDRIVTSDVASELSYVREALLGREHLERIVRENGLDNTVTSAEFDGLLDRVRGAIRIQSSQASGENRIYNISYRHTRRETAVGVVRTLLNSMVEDTLGANRVSTDTAQTFLDERIQEYENRLQRAEQALADFRREHVGRLPGTVGEYFERMQEERDALDSVKMQLRLAEARRERLQEQLLGDSPVLPLAYRPGGNALAELPASTFDARIQEYQAQLDRLRLDYTDRHPDVIAVRETLARLEAQRAEELARTGATINQVPTEANPVYQTVQIRLNDTEVEIASLRTDVAERTARLDALRALVDEVPEVEAELARLNRDYDVIYDQYQALVQSRETQALSSKASDADQVDFRVINPPLASTDPVAPRRLLLIAATFVFSLGAAGALCYVLSQLRPVFGETRTLGEVTGLPVLGAIGVAAVDPAGLRHRRLATISFAVAMLALGVLFVGIVAFEVAGPGVHALLRRV